MLTTERKTVTGAPLTGNLVFYQNLIPPLATDSAGEHKNKGIHGAYRFTVEQTVSSAAGEIPETTYENTHHFTVKGARFSLPEEISSVYPPEGDGPFSNVLAHVCFNRGTLPWERSIGKQNSKPAAQSDQAPWLGILLLHQTDPAVTVKQVQLMELLSGEKGKLPKGTLYPAFELEYEEKLTDQCLVMDVPIDLFNQIAPAASDLPWLAHVREIQPSSNQSEKYLDKLKSISSETSLPKLSTVVANRLPLKGATNTACLVSFENWAAYLPDEDGNQSENIPEGTTTIRLVLLKQWQFSVYDKNETFAGYLTNLNKKDGTYAGSFLQLPINEDTSEADKAINNAFNMGYVPLNHHTRQGDDTVSWYKGPFVPYAVDGNITIPVNGPDSCTAYNPNTGMFDVSYAGAWQLGKLLALQNGNFAQSLYNWKRANLQTIISNFEAEIIKKKLSEIAKEQEQPARDTSDLSALQPELLQVMNSTLSTILSKFITNKDSGGNNGNQ